MKIIVFSTVLIFTCIGFLLCDKDPIEGTLETGSVDPDFKENKILFKEL